MFSSQWHHHPSFYNKIWIFDHICKNIFELWLIESNIPHTCKFHNTDLIRNNTWNSHCSIFSFLLTIVCIFINISFVIWLYVVRMINCGYPLCIFINISFVFCSSYDFRLPVLVSFKLFVQLKKIYTNYYVASSVR
jgi:hypothetical protein